MKGPFSYHCGGWIALGFFHWVTLTWDGGSCTVVILLSELLLYINIVETRNVQLLK